MAEYRQPLAIYVKLANDFPAVPSHSEQLAWSYNNVAYMLYQMRQFAEAETEYRRGLAIVEKLIKDFPTVPGYARQLGHICVNMGNLVRDGGRPEAALVWYDRAVTTLEATFGADRQRIVEPEGSFVRQRMCALNVGGNRQQPRRYVSVSRSAVRTASA